MTEEESSLTATIALNGSFTAADMDEIIADLARARASLFPGVPNQPPTNLDAPMLEQHEPQFRIRTLAAGGLRIWLRHEGFGWIAFTLSARQRKELVEFLAKKAGHTHTMQ